MVRPGNVGAKVGVVGTHDGIFSRVKSFADATKASRRGHVTRGRDRCGGSETRMLIHVAKETPVTFFNNIQKRERGLLISVLSVNQTTFKNNAAASFYLCHRFDS